MGASAVASLTLVSWLARRRLGALARRGFFIAGASLAAVPLSEIRLICQYDVMRPGVGLWAMLVAASGWLLVAIFGRGGQNS